MLESQDDAKYDSIALPQLGREPLTSETTTSTILPSISNLALPLPPVQQSEHDSPYFPEDRPKVWRGKLLHTK